MGKKIIFYGGCQGVDKSQLLKDAIEIVKRKNPSVLINDLKASKFFVSLIKADRGSTFTSEKILWHQEDWKRYDQRVMTELCSQIRSTNGISIINSHFCVPYKAKENYLPGLEMHSIEKMLYDSFFDNQKNKLLRDITPPCFGVLLIDPEPSLIIKRHEELYYKDEIKNDVILNYVSEQSINRDLEQNRIWSNAYCDTAIAVLGKKNVYRETIYITKELIANGYLDINTKIAEFLRKFAN